MRKGGGPLSGSVPAASGGAPGAVRYAPDHTWALPLADRARVGITAVAARGITHATHVRLPRPGERVERGGELAVIEMSKATLEVSSPLSGLVVATNPLLRDEPAAVKSDPQGAAWLVELASLRPEEWEALLTADRYEALSGESVRTVEEGGKP